MLLFHGSLIYFFNRCNIFSKLQTEFLKVLLFTELRLVVLFFLPYFLVSLTSIEIWSFVVSVQRCYGCTNISSSSWFTARPFLDALTVECSIQGNQPLSGGSFQEHNHDSSLISVPLSAVTLRPDGCLPGSKQLSMSVSSR